MITLTSTGINFVAGKLGHSYSFHTGIISILFLPPGALLLISFKNGFSTGNAWCATD
jgi:hypothetical protein